MQYQYMEGLQQVKGVEVSTLDDRCLPVSIAAICRKRKWQQMGGGPARPRMVHETASYWSWKTAAKNKMPF